MKLDISENVPKWGYTDISFVKDGKTFATRQWPVIPRIGEKMKFPSGKIMTIVDVVHTDAKGGTVYEWQQYVSVYCEDEKAPNASNEGPPLAAVPLD